MSHTVGDLFRSPTIDGAIFLIDLTTMLNHCQSMEIDMVREVKVALGVLACILVLNWLNCTFGLLNNF